MSAKLSLRLLKYLGGAGTTEGAVTQLYALDEAGRREPKRDLRNLVIPAGYGANPLIVDVEAGEYLVEAVLPSGDIATEQVRLAEGSAVNLDLESPHSPHEWLSWQQYLGNVPARPEPTPTSRARRGGTSAAPIRRRRGAVTQVQRMDDFARGVTLGDDGPGVATAEPVEGARAPRRRAARAPAWPTVWFVGDPVEALRGDAPAGAGAGAWAVLAEAATRRDPLKAVSGRPPRPSKQRVRDEVREIHTFGAAGPILDDHRDPGGGAEVPRRYVVSVAPGGPVELACLPVPWDSGPYGRVPVEVLVRRRPLPGEAMLAMSPRDPSIGPALGYMGTGALSNARVIIDRARNLLYGKQINPLAAAAGGYVLLATMEGDEDQAWHAWIQNLAAWYAWLPDGMIQKARLKLRRRQNQGDIDEARGMFFEAYDRGIPFYSLGLQWLVDGLSLLATRDEEARRRLATVQEVAWRANLQQPFTTIRLRG